MKPAPIEAKSGSRVPATLTEPARLRPVVLMLLAAGVALPAYGGGVLTVLHILFLSVLPVLWNTAAKDRTVAILWACSVGWALAQLLSDFIHNTEPFSGQMAAGPTIALMVTGLVWAHRRVGLTVPSILTAIGIGWICLEAIAGHAVASPNPWKYGFSSPIVLTVIGIAYWRKMSAVSVAALLSILAAISLYFDSRFSTGLLLVSAIALILMKITKSVKKNSALVLSGVLAVVAIFAAYPAVALSGALGQRAQAQQVTYESQDSNFLLATRLELPHTFYLAIQNPILGIGAFGKSDVEDSMAALDFVNTYVAPLDVNSYNYLLGQHFGYPGYNAHTAIMGTFLFAGVLALPFWFFVIARSIHALKNLGNAGGHVPALVVYFAGLTLWDVFFSPLSTRSHVAFAVALFITCVSVADQKLPVRMPSVRSDGLRRGKGRKASDDFDLSKGRRLSESALG